MRHLILGSGPAGIAAARAARKTEKDAEGVKIKSGKRARRVDAAKNRILFSDGTEEPYNFLCIASGGKPILPLALMGSFGSFLSLNSLGDALRIKARALRTDVSVVFGPGYLGLEAARALRKLGQPGSWGNPRPPRLRTP